MKSLPAALLLVIFGVGCGGYGSGMGTTPAPMPNIAPASGTYTTPLAVNMADSVQNAIIYYTIDGTPPTLSSPIYRGSITLSQPGSVTVQAIAAAGGYATSPVAIANFTLH